jgi:ADP-heptose:LPS heptosyltransferase
MQIDAAPPQIEPRRPAINWARVTRVLLVRLRSIGDTVLMTPCLKALKDWAPDVEIGVVTEPLSSPVLKGHPLIDRLFEVDKTFASRLRAMRRIRKWRPEAAFNLHGGTTGMIMAMASGAYYTVGYRGQRGSWMLTTPAPGPDLLLGRKTMHSVEQQLALLYYAGVAWPEVPEIDVAPNLEPIVDLQRTLAGLGVAADQLGQFACIAPGAAFESKRWSADRFGAIVDHLAQRWKTESLILAGPGQESIARDVAAASRSGARVLSGLTLNELAAVLRRYACIFIGNDSGVMHIAAAMGCSIVGVFGSSNPDIWHPWTRTPYRVVGGERGRQDGDLREAIDRVTVEEVAAAVDDLMRSAVRRDENSLVRL